MRRLAVLLLCCAATSIVAAPAPLPRREREYGPWVNGWDRPVDPVGGCRFQRKGDRLTILVPEPQPRGSPANVPRLMREVEGDFTLVVRVTAGVPADGQVRGAGLLLSSETTFAQIQLHASWHDRQATYQFAAGADGGGRAPAWVGNFTPRYRGHLWLRMDRRGKGVRLSYGFDGAEWYGDMKVADLGLPAKVRPGVFARGYAGGAFAAHFDRLEFTPARR